MRQSIFQWILILGLLLTLAVPAAAHHLLVIDGTGDSQELLRALAKTFESTNRDVRIAIPNSLGSTGGVKSLVNGKCGLARVSRPLTEAELTRYPNLNYWVFARSPVVFIAKLSRRGVDNLSEDQIFGILSGTISDWSELGSCPAHKIYVAQREEGDSSHRLLYKTISALDSLTSPAGKVIYSTPETVKTLKETPFAIGYSPLAAVDPHLQVFSLNGIAPGEAAIQSGSYPMTIPFGVVWKGKLSVPAARFVAFIASPAGQKIIRSYGAVPTSSD